MFQSVTCFHGLRTRYGFPALLAVLGLTGIAATTPIDLGPSPAVPESPARLEVLPALRIYNVRVQVQGQRVLVSWETTTRADTAVTVAGRRVETAGQDGYLHAMTLTDLAAGATYELTVVARDAQGNAAECGPFPFCTPPPPAVAKQVAADPICAHRGRDAHFDRDEAFGSRLVIARIWIEQLKQRGKIDAKHDRTPKLLQILYYSNKARAESKLEKLYLELSLLEHQR